MEESVDSILAASEMPEQSDGDIARTEVVEEVFGCGKEIGFSGLA